MPVSDAARQEVQDRCGGDCQLFHRQPFPGAMIIHPRHQGMGGLPEDHPLNQPKRLIWGCQHCHDLIDARGEHAAPYKITEIDADHVDEEGGWDPILEILDDKGRPIAPEEIWLHRYRRRQTLVDILDTLRGVQLAEGQHAMAMLALADDYDLLDPEAEDESQMFWSQGFDPDSALLEVEAARWVTEHDLEWPPGLTVRKVLRYSRSAQRRLWEALDHTEIQEALRSAVAVPKQTIDDELRRLGVKQPQKFFYVLFEPTGGDGGLVEGKLRLVRTRDLDRLVSEMGTGTALLQIQAFRAGWRFTRGKDGGVVDWAGNKIPYEERDGEDSD